MTTLTIEGKQYVLVRAEQYDRLVAAQQTMPELPPRNRQGRRPAAATTIVMIARAFIRRRLAAGWTQEDFAREAGVRVTTIARIESGKHRPQRATVQRLDRVLDRAGV